MRRLAIFGALASGVVVAVLACSGFEEDASPSPDATTDEAAATASSDAAPAPSDAAPMDGAAFGACDLDAPFGQPTEIDVVGESGVFIATLTEDERTMYYDTARVPDATPGSRMFRVERTRVDAPFGPPVDLAGINGGNSGRASLSGDGRTIVFFSDRGLDAGLLIATREIATAEFKDPKPLALRARHGITQIGALTYDGRTLYYTASPDGGIFRSERVEDDFASGALLPEFEPSDGPPHVTRDGRTAYFTRRVTDGRNDIYRARRAADGTFGSIESESTVNTEDDEILMFVSWDGCRLYFNRRRTNDTGSILVVAKPAR